MVAQRKRARRPVADTHDHVHLLGDESVDEAAGRRGIVGQVAAGEDVEVRFNIGEHAANHVALARPPLAADDGTRFGRDRGGAVGRVVVVDIDGSAGQEPAEFRHYLPDRRLLIEARQ